MVSSAQIEAAEAVILLVILFNGFTLTESVDLHPFASVSVTKYLVGPDGKTMGVAVLPKIIFADGDQEKTATTGCG